MKPTRSDELSPEFTLLGLLYDSPSHGYELHQSILTHLGYIWNISQSQTYSVLKRMEEKGYISAGGEKGKTSSPQTLSITEAGKERFDWWLGKVSPSTARGIRLGFFTRLYFLQKLFPHNVENAILNQLDAISKQKKRLSDALTDGLNAAGEISTNPGDPNLLSLDLRVAQLNAIEQWLLQNFPEVARKK